MSDDRPEPDRIEGAPHPRETARLIGQDRAEADFLKAYTSGRLHSGWLITGPKGVGKATLAYRIAAFLLAGLPGQGGDQRFVTFGQFFQCERDVVEIVEGVQALTVVFQFPQGLRPAEHQCRQ